MWKPKSNKLTSRVSNTFSGKSQHYLGLSPQRDRRRNSNSSISSSSCRPPDQQLAAATGLSDGSSSTDEDTSVTTPTSPSSSSNKSSSLFDLSVFGRKSPAAAAARGRCRHFAKPTSSSQIHPASSSGQHHHHQSSQQFHSKPTPYVDMPLQFNFGSTYASSLTVFFDNN